MNAENQSQSLTERKLEEFLNRACRAEAEGDYKEAQRLFELALFCEGRLRADVTDARQYAYTAAAVYN